ncbi:MAG: copper-binding protein [Caulobacter sp.]|nr:copper-binding protein [Caulobacter sp.]
MKSHLMIAALTAVLSTAGLVAPALAHGGEDHAAAPQAAEGQGEVVAVDAKAGTVILKHGPIPALKWPAMTMKFKVESAAVLEGVTVGAKVHFELKNVGGKPVVSEIHVL